MYKKHTTFYVGNKLTAHSLTMMIIIMFTSQWHPILINNEDRRDKCAVVQCSTLPITWTDVQKKFILKFKLGKDCNSSYVTVSVSYRPPIDNISRLRRRWLVPILHHVAKKKLEQIFSTQDQHKNRQSSVLYIYSSLKQVVNKILIFTQLIFKVINLC